MANTNEMITINSEQNTFCTLTINNDSDKVKLFNAINNADGGVDDMVGKTIVIKDVYAEQYTDTNEETGEPTDKIMLTLIDIEGKTYATNSVGVYNSLKRAFTVFGMPTWDDGLAFEVVKQATKNGRKTTVLKAI